MANDGAVAQRIGGSDLTKPGSKAVPGIVQRPKQGQQQKKIIYVVYMFLYGKAFFNEVEWLPILLFIHIKLGQVENYVFGNIWQHVWQQRLLTSLFRYHVIFAFGVFFLGPGKPVQDVPLSLGIASCSLPAKAGCAFASKRCRQRFHPRVCSHRASVKKLRGLAAAGTWRQCNRKMP